MAIAVETKDCTQLSDAELAEMADICAEGPSTFEAGLLSKQAEAWVLVSIAREGNNLRGFSYCTLERIGFNIGVGDYGDLVTAVWISKSGPLIDRAVVEIDGGCMVYSTIELSPVGFDVIKPSFEVMMRRIDPDAPALEYDWTDDEDGFRTVYYTLDENPDLLVGVGQGWRNGRAARGSVYVLVKPW